MPSVRERIAPDPRWIAFAVLSRFVGMCRAALHVISRAEGQAAESFDQGTRVEGLQQKGADAA